MQVDLSVISLVLSETPDSAAGDQRAVCVCGQGNRRGMQEHRIPSRGCSLLVIGGTRVEPTSEDSESECVLVLDYNSSTRVLPFVVFGNREPDAECPHLHTDTSRRWQVLELPRREQIYSRQQHRGQVAAGGPL